MYKGYLQQWITFHYMLSTSMLKFSLNNPKFCWTQDSHGGDYEECYLMTYNVVQCGESPRRFGGAYRLHFQGRRLYFLLLQTGFLLGLRSDVD
jgi:hypothetical protein